MHPNKDEVGLAWMNKVLLAKLRKGRLIESRSKDRQPGRDTKTISVQGSGWKSQSPGRIKFGQEHQGQQERLF